MIFHWSTVGTHNVQRSIAMQQYTFVLCFKTHLWYQRTSCFISLLFISSLLSSCDTLLHTSFHITNVYVTDTYVLMSESLPINEASNVTYSLSEKTWRTAGVLSLPASTWWKAARQRGQIASPSGWTQNIPDLHVFELREEFNIKLCTDWSGLKAQWGNVSYL